MLRKLIITCISVIFLFSLSIPANSATKPGTSCKKIGQISISSGKKYTCVKSGKKLVWNKGVAVKRVAPTPTSTPTPSPTPTPAPSISPTPWASPTPTQSTSPSNNQRVSAKGVKESGSEDNVSNCKLATKFDSNIETTPWLKEVKLGFPKAPNRLKSSGVIKAIMIFVSFNDVKASGNPLEESKEMTEGFNRFIKENSYGKVSVEFTIPPKYFQITKNSNVYGMNKWNSGDARQYLNDGIAAADAEVDFSPFDLVFVIPPADISEIVFGPAFPEAGGFAITVDSARITSSAVAGSDSRNPKVMLTPWVWMAHETGHLFGLPHPYLNVTGPAPYWDLMFWNVGGPGHYGWNRFVIGWIEDERVFCANKSSDFQVLIAPLSSENKRKNLIVIPESSHKAIVIENRRGSEIDALNQEQEGIIVYEVFLEYPNEQIRLFETGRKINGHETGVIKPGNSIVINGIAISNLGSYLEGDLVGVSKRN